MPRTCASHDTAVNTGQGPAQSTSGGRYIITILLLPARRIWTQRCSPHLVCVVVEVKGVVFLPSKPLQQDGDEQCEDDVHAQHNDDDGVRDGADVAVGAKVRVC